MLGRREGTERREGAGEEGDAREVEGCWEEPRRELGRKGVLGRKRVLGRREGTEKREGAREEGACWGGRMVLRRGRVLGRRGGGEEGGCWGGGRVLGRREGVGEEEGSWEEPRRVLRRRSKPFPGLRNFNTLIQVCLDLEKKHFPVTCAPLSASTVVISH